MEFGVSSGYIKTGEQQMTANPNGWTIHTTGIGSNLRTKEYYDCLNIGTQIKDAVDDMKNAAGSDFGARNTAPAPQPAAPKEPVICPFCGAKTVPENGCCEYCGSQLN